MSHYASECKSTVRDTAIKDAIDIKDRPHVKKEAKRGHNKSFRVQTITIKVDSSEEEQVSSICMISTK
jgi:hypothetical protein